MAAITATVVNVATVPLRSPFRYPGGKTWLVPHVRLWLKSLGHRPSEFIEPFAGGAILGLTAAFENLADHVTLVELDEDVAAVWQVILDGDGERLANDLYRFQVTLDNVRAVLATDGASTYERAFATIIKNRVQRGGILAPGASLVKRGENGHGIKSRWYPRTLRRRILDIVAHREKISFVRGDGMEALLANASRADAVYFIDPPYTVAGKRLYKYSVLDHDNLFRVASSLAGHFVMTYDDAHEIRYLADKYGLDTERVIMKNTHHERKYELLVGRDLDWARAERI